MSDSVCSADQHQARPRYHRPHHHHHHHHQSHHHDHDGHHNNNPALRGDERWGPAAREGSGPHRQPQPRPRSRRRSQSRSRSPSPTSASSSCSSAGYRNEKALVPRARSARRGSALSDAGESGPEEYTVYPDGRIHEHRRGGRRRFGRNDGQREWGRGRGRGEDRGGYDGFAKGRRRSREEAKGFLLAALVVVAGVILCWD